MTDRGGSGREQTSEVYPNVVFPVGTRSYCIWDSRLSQNNLAFCERLDADWFLETVRRLGDEIGGEDEVPQSAAHAIRLTYHHALETFLALLMAAYQAPRCVPAWLDLYRTPELDDLVASVGSGRKMLNAWQMPSPTWEDLARLFHEPAWRDDTVRDTAGEFAGAWKRLAREWLSENHRAEYNGTKHGLKALPGGVFLRAAREEKEGVAPPPESAVSIGGSRYGTQLLRVAAIDGRKNPRGTLHLRVERRILNWTVEATIGRVHILTLSIKNVLGAIRVAHGVKPGDIVFHRLEDPDAYLTPFREAFGVTGMRFSIDPPNRSVLEHSREKVEALVRRQSGLEPTDDGVK